VFADRSFIVNKATEGSTANQNLASNVGQVDINAPQLQLVAMHGSAVLNMAKGGSTAVQNLSTNTSCVSCD